MPETPLIRRATRADVPAIQALLQEQASHHGETLQAGPEALERYGFGPFTLFRCLLAERGAEALGFALYYPDFSTLRGRPGIMLQDIFVRPAARGLGLGRTLLAEVIADARAWEAGFLTLMLDRHNAPARAFYARHGFAPRGDYDLLILEGQGLNDLMSQDAG
jgi:GNAT superfamily N-acetyltransferase